jgi:hypothetical protein
MGLGLAVDLSFDQRRIDLAGADCVAGDAVLGGDVGRLERRGDEPMRGRDIDDAPKPVRAHRRYGGESGIRTHGTVSRTHAFQACALSHSAISPDALS